MLLQAQNLVLETVTVQCPWCFEPIEVVIDCSVPQQQYVEDCEVCCRPIDLRIQIDDRDQPHVEAWRENQ